MPSRAGSSSEGEVVEYQHNKATSHNQPRERKINDSGRPFGRDGASDEYGVFVCNCSPCLTMLTTKATATVEHPAVRHHHTVGTAIDRLRPTALSAMLVEIQGRPPRSATDEPEALALTMPDRTTSARPRRHAVAVRTSASTRTEADTASIGLMCVTTILALRPTRALLAMRSVPQSLCPTQIQTMRLPSPISASIYAPWQNRSSTVAATSNKIAPRSRSSPFTILPTVHKLTLHPNRRMP